MHFNAFGKIANEEWALTPEIRKNISLGDYMIMPNHFHAIISINYQIKEASKQDIGKFQSPSQTIGAIIRGFKGATTKRINNLIRENRKSSTGELLFAPNGPKGNLAPTCPSGQGSIWQRNYYEHIIRTERAYTNISNYIINNPKNWNNDKLKHHD